jgi:hypothetical protein
MGMLPLRKAHKKMHMRQGGRKMNMVVVGWEIFVLGVAFGSMVLFSELTDPILERNRRLKEAEK